MDVLRFCTVARHSKGDVDKVCPFGWMDQITGRWTGSSLCRVGAIFVCTQNIWGANLESLATQTRWNLETGETVRFITGSLVCKFKKKTNVGVSQRFLGGTKNQNAICQTVYLTREAWKSGGGHWGFLQFRDEYRITDSRQLTPRPLKKIDEHHLRTYVGCLEITCLVK